MSATAVRRSGHRRALGALIALLTAAVAACTSGPGEAASSRSALSRGATISGTIVSVGGPVHSTPHPMSAIAVAYPRVTAAGLVSGAPVAEGPSSARHGGHFSMTVRPGVYYLVAERPNNSAVTPRIVITSPVRVDVSSRRSVAVQLQVSIP